jgi:type I restriction enzyme, S subunit
MTRESVPLPSLPESWQVRCLGYEATVKARLGWRGLKAEEYVDDGYILLATPNIKARDIDFANVNFITHDRYLESPEIMLMEGDVLLAKDGSTLGTTNVVRTLTRPATVNSSIAVVRPKRTLHPIFLYWWLTAEFIQATIRQMKDGMGVPHLFQSDI